MPLQNEKLFMLRSGEGEMKVRLIYRTVPLLVLLSWAAGTGISAGFQDEETLVLTDAVDMGLRTHPRILAAEANESASFAAIGRARADKYPLINTQASLTQFQKPMIVAPLHGFDPTNPPQFEKTLIRGDVSFGYKLYDGGARKSRVAGAEARSAGASAVKASARSALAAEIAYAYLEVLTADGVLAAQMERIEALSSERRRVDLLLTEGRAARVELSRVDAALAQAEAERVASEARLKLAERELARLIEVEPGETRVDNLRSVRLRDQALSEEWAEWLEAAKASSPELERAERSVDSADAEWRVARAARIPEVGVLAAYQGFGSTNGGGSLEWSAGVGLTYPIFTGGARTNAILEAEARLRQAREKLRVIELDIQKGIDWALTVAVETRALAEAVDETVHHQSEVARIEQLSLEAGAGLQSDYLRAEADLADARSALVVARHQEIAAWIELARVAGVLLPDWMERHLEGVR
jgi:outer membrane protein